MDGGGFGALGGGQGGCVTRRGGKLAVTATKLPDFEVLFGVVFMIGKQLVEKCPAVGVGTWKAFTSRRRSGGHLDEDGKPDATETNGIVEVAGLGSRQLPRECCNRKTQGHNPISPYVTSRDGGKKNLFPRFLMR